MTDHDQAFDNLPPETLDALFDQGQDRARQENPLNEHITDPTTGLYNAAYTALKLSDEVKKARRFSLPLSLVLLGINPKSPTGVIQDEDKSAMLNEVAGLLLCECRDIDHLARMGENELLMLLPHTPGQGAAAMARRILNSIEERGFGSDGSPELESWIGVASFEGSGVEDAEELMERAFEGLATSRNWGTGRVTAWHPSEENSD